MWMQFISSCIQELLLSRLWSICFFGVTLKKKKLPYKTVVECEISSDLELSAKEKTADKCGHSHLRWDRLGYEGISLCLLCFLF